MIKIGRWIIDWLSLGFYYPFCFLLGKFSAKREKPRLVWGPVGILNYHYASLSMKEAGWDAKTYVFEAATSINKQTDYDVIINKLPLFWIPFIGKFIRAFFYFHVAFINSLFKFDFFHTSFDGWILGSTEIKKHEARLMHLAGKKIFVSSYGGDTFAYSRVHSPLQRHGLLMSYPENARTEEQWRDRNSYWQKNADVLITGSMYDQIGRWDVLPFNYVTIDETCVSPKKEYSLNNGHNGVVHVFHCPNHRGLKGTDYIVQAVKDLKQEGLQIELHLIEKKQNAELLLELQNTADILAEQCILNAYGLNGIEGMACGVPILCNLESQFHTEVFRIYSYLNECPAVSVGPLTVKEKLRWLVTHPQERERLGRMGRQYIEKYHSKKAARYIYENCIRKEWNNEKIDLLNLFNPLRASVLDEIHPKLKPWATNGGH